MPVKDEVKTAADKTVKAPAHTEEEYQALLAEYNKLVVAFNKLLKQYNEMHVASLFVEDK